MLLNYYYKITKLSNHGNELANTENMKMNRISKLSETEAYIPPLPKTCLLATPKHKSIKIFNLSTIVLQFITIKYNSD